MTNRPAAAKLSLSSRAHFPCQTILFSLSGYNSARPFSATNSFPSIPSDKYFSSANQTLVYAEVEEEEGNENSSWRGLPSARQQPRSGV